MGGLKLFTYDPLGMDEIASIHMSFSPQIEETETMSDKILIANRHMACVTEIDRSEIIITLE